ncbi:Zn(II)2Cys6 transcription factor domain-containing protein [Aspergillus foveolatus]|uniref:Zn(II)2Cys6 transcription factor domain-containing protein n=1 Tax=Aspergillus foveolatus TaxID=210207 RepID=UPI003CCCCA0C
MQRPPRSRASTQYTFQRAYKACIPCRRRKVKCESEPEYHQPCRRCRKMELECRFSSKQPWSRKKHAGESGTRGVRHASSEYEPPGMRRLNGAATATTITAIDDVHEPSPSNSASASASAGLEDGECISATVLQKQVASGNDAMNILFDAAAHAGSSARVGNGQATALDDSNTPFDIGSEDNVLRVWEGCRFVKMGWFTAEEALSYTDWLWQHCQHLILRIMLGQEKLSKAKTRHISTIEALLLLSEWYPLALHFPLEADGWDSDWMLTTFTLRDPPSTAQECPMQDRWKEDVVEPTRRSDRMSWMLVSSALALAHELGVFNPRNHITTSKRQGAIAGPDVENYLQDLELRRQRLPSLLFVTANLLASRIGCTSIMPDYGKEPLESLMTVDPDWARFMISWVNLTGLTRTLRDTFFTAAKSAGSQHINFASLEQWKAQLAAWQDHIHDIQSSRYNDILCIEYQYLRVFANSLGVQGIVERVLSDTPSRGTIDTTFVSQARQLNMSRNEYEFIEEVIDGACTILSHVVALANPRCLPMRVLSRMISSSIFLLKALALGVRKTKLEESLHLLDAAIAALLCKPLDDIHLASKYATLLKTHVSRLRQTFASSGRVDSQKTEPTRGDNGESEQSLGTAFGLDNNMMDWSTQADLNSWLSLPLDPLMAPFGSWDGAPADLRLDSDPLDLDFIWNLPP